MNRLKAGSADTTAHFPNKLHENILPYLKSIKPLYVIRTLGVLIKNGAEHLWVYFFLVSGAKRRTFWFVYQRNLKDENQRRRWAKRRCLRSKAILCFPEAAYEALFSFFLLFPRGRRWWWKQEMWLMQQHPREANKILLQIPPWKPILLSRCVWRVRGEFYIQFFTAKTVEQVSSNWGKFKL